MSLKKVKTTYFIQELETSGHHPMKFYCDDDNLYYLKHRCDMKKQEIVFLCYEVVCNIILNHLNIPTPEIAIVEIQANSYDKKVIKYNRYLQPGSICFGSKELKDSNLVADLEIIKRKSEYNSIFNAYDLIKIALFDLWTQNMDRKPTNINLMKRANGNKYELFAIDQAFCFGGINGIGIFNPKFAPTISDKLFYSDYFQSIIKYIPKTLRYQLVYDFIEQCDETCKNKIQDIFPSIPDEWIVTPNLSERIVTFLFDPDRLDQIKNQAIVVLRKIK